MKLQKQKNGLKNKEQWESLQKKQMMLLLLLLLLCPWYDRFIPSVCMLSPYTYACRFKYARTHARTHAYAHTHAHTRTHTYAHTHARTHAHTHAHTHTRYSNTLLPLRTLHTRVCRDNIWSWLDSGYMIVLFYSYRRWLRLPLLCPWSTWLCAAQRE